MSICLITGDHPRHHFLAQEIIKTGKVSAWVIEKREEFLPSPPDNIQANLAKLFIHHFNEREKVEREVFGSSFYFDLPILNVDKDNLNSKKTIDFLSRYHPKIILSYGCHKLSSDLIFHAKCRFWNSHGGLSPEYRGAITHFWPSYFLEPQMTGMTLHETTESLDSGSIILQTSAPMVRGDSLHRLAARNLEHYTSELYEKLMKLDLNEIPYGIKQKSYGRVFMAKDWRPEHLRLIYETYNDRIVDAVLDGHIIGRYPNLLAAI